MFHGINAWLARHLRQANDYLGLARDNDLAAAQGWQANKIRLGTWSSRDPRFAYRKFALTETGTGCEFCDDKIAEWLYSDLPASNQLEKARRWR
jgi:hypothetical protein